jgi:hypothetical protein
MHNRKDFLDVLSKMDNSSWDLLLERVNSAGWTVIDGKFTNSIHDPITIDDWNRAKIKPSTKIRIESPEHRSYILKLAEELSFYYMRDVMTSPFLFFWDDMCIAASIYEPDFKEDNRKEIFIEMPKEEPKNEIINNAPKGGSSLSGKTKSKDTSKVSWVTDDVGLYVEALKSELKELALGLSSDSDNEEDFSISIDDKIESLARELFLKSGLSAEDCWKDAREFYLVGLTVVHSA